MVSAILVLLGIPSICAIVYGASGFIPDDVVYGQRDALDGPRTFMAGATGLVVVVGIGLWRWHAA